MEINCEVLFSEGAAVAREITEKANLTKGNILVIGCSTSEILGEKIGTCSTPEAAKAVLEGILSVTAERGIFIAAQCCEHLNRAIVTEKAAVPGGEYVNVRPMPKAGGSFATAAFEHFEDPVVLEEIKADAGIDIGFTLIGMHLKKVAVPVRLENNKIGCATVLAARVRPKFIGGSRAFYIEEML